MIFQHTATFSPIALYQLDGNLLDTSGNGLDLSLLTGTAQYASICPKGPVGFLFDRVCKIGRTTTALLAMAGDMTIEMLISLGLEPGATTSSIVMYRGSTAASANNPLYDFGLVNGNTFSYRAKVGTSTPDNITYDFAAGSMSGQILHLAFRRSTNNVSVFLNGRIADTSTGLSAPDGGSTSTFQVGNNPANNQDLGGVIASMKIHNVALTNDQILSDFEDTVGEEFPRV